MPALRGSDANNCAHAGLSGDRAVQTVRVIVKAWATCKALDDQAGFESGDLPMFPLDLEDPFRANGSAVRGKRGLLPRPVLAKRREFRLHGAEPVQRVDTRQGFLDSGGFRNVVRGDVVGILRG